MYISFKIYRDSNVKWISEPKSKWRLKNSPFHNLIYLIYTDKTIPLQNSTILSFVGKNNIVKIKKIYGGKTTFKNITSICNDFMKEEYPNYTEPLRG